ncbi:MAG: VWA domain-containing protein [Terracidiphilus sp.]
MNRTEHFGGVAALLLVAALGSAQAQQNPAEPPDPTLTHRPAPKAAAAPSVVTLAGRMRLDVTVTDAGGKPVPGLGPQDFKVLDNNGPRKILTFRSYDGVTVKPDPPVQAILVIDTANLPFQQVAFVRNEVGKFLGENGGRLAEPVSIMLLTDAGLRVQPRPSTDGRALLGVLNEVKGSIHSINAAEGGEGDLERFQLSVRQLSTIAENEALKPGRKLLIWVGPGWPMLDSSKYSFSERDQRRYFDSIVELSTKLREGRVVVDSVAPAASTTASGLGTTLYQNFLKGVRMARQADSGNLALKVVAIESGGLVLGPDNDLAGQIDRCVGEANAFYTLTFDPGYATAPNEYHDLKVEVDQPGMTARTRTGYYNQPQQLADASR